jgi:2-keto-4-pentenoate hydratase/2-oxohepta-3-ene-1,7-dioic acid hydratase in catechol pathway
LKLVTFSRSSGPLTLGVTDGVAVTAIAGRIPGAPNDMIALIDRWPAWQKQLETITTFDYPLRELRLHAPVPRPGKIFGIGMNYADHAAEAGGEPPKDQIWFSKAVTAVTGPYDPVERPIVSHMLDYEGELVVVVGKRCRHVSAAQALEAIFGYSVGNDVSVRDWQLRTSQYVLGKSFDTHAPFGPWIVTADSIDARDLEIATFVNGERRQHSRTRQLIFDCAAQIAHLSKAMTLEPGDVIFTGTPAGVGGARKPPAWLQRGDVVRVEIEGVGAIENPIVDEPAATRQGKLDTPR